MVSDVLGTAQYDDNPDFYRYLGDLATCRRRQCPFPLLGTGRFCSDECKRNPDVPRPDDRQPLTMSAMQEAQHLARGWNLLRYVIEQGVTARFTVIHGGEKPQDADFDQLVGEAFARLLTRVRGTDFHGESQRAVKFAYRVAKNTVTSIYWTLARREMIETDPENFDPSTQQSTPVVHRNPDGSRNLPEDVDMETLGKRCAVVEELADAITAIEADYEARLTAESSVADAIDSLDLSQWKKDTLHTFAYDELFDGPTERKRKQRFCATVDEFRNTPEARALVRRVAAAVRGRA